MTEPTTPADEPIVREVPITETEVTHFGEDSNQLDNVGDPVEFDLGSDDDGEGAA